MPPCSSPPRPSTLRSGPPRPSPASLSDSNTDYIPASFYIQPPRSAPLREILSPSIIFIRLSTSLLDADATAKVNRPFIISDQSEAEITPESHFGVEHPVAVPTPEGIYVDGFYDGGMCVVVKGVEILGKSEVWNSISEDIEVGEAERGVGENEELLRGFGVV
ncbi:hypothetical protein B0T14DRAFT_494239 [Immersiella caudata]|uniref:Uncharacterized protein n=1 Tax=Immersiella caudata TaxID=314043 RepID=A0AA40C265_9PEZI|nr:hypothetical protein B0T14DRAFT_494239 [Immersiella caudata]